MKLMWATHSQLSWANKKAFLSTSAYVDPSPSFPLQESIIYQDAKDLYVLTEVITAEEETVHSFSTNKLFILSGPRKISFSNLASVPNRTGKVFLVWLPFKLHALFSVIASTLSHYNLHTRGNAKVLGHVEGALWHLFHTKSTFLNIKNSVCINGSPHNLVLQEAFSHILGCGWPLIV